NAPSCRHSRRFRRESAPFIWFRASAKNTHPQKSGKNSRFRNRSALNEVNIFRIFMSIFILTENSPFCNTLYQKNSPFCDKIFRTRGLFFRHLDD
ncbi:MAG: hypothetical protein LUI01_04180, partial [Firmicutes bacterium]|nr:hypothetical protein [Bacillota bacterium]